jgi:hypothetical protein
MQATYKRMKTLGRPATFDELLALLAPEGFDELEGDFRTMRKTFVCPLTVQNEEEFTDTLADYHGLLYATKFPGACGRMNCAERRQQYDSFGSQQFYDAMGGWKEYSRCLNNAQRGINGGMIGVIDKWTEIMIRHAFDHHVLLICDKHLPYDGETWEDTGRKLIDQYGRFLCTEDEHIFYPGRREDVVTILTAFALKRRSARDLMAHMAAKDSAGTP